MSTTFVLRLPVADECGGYTDNMVFLPPDGLSEWDIRDHAKEVIKIAHAAPSFSDYLDIGLTKTYDLIVTELEKRGYTLINEVSGPVWDRD